MKLSRKKVGLMLIVLMGVLIMSSLITAAKYNITANVTANKASLSVGETVNVTVAIASTEQTGGFHVQYHLNYDHAILKLKKVIGDGGNLTDDTYINDAGQGQETSLVTYEFEALKITDGTSVSISAEIIELVNEELTINETTGTKQVTISIGEKSNNAFLNGIALSAGSLNPAFSPEVLSYEITVPNSVAELALTPQTADPKAAVSISGTNALKVGVNKRDITVVAEDGTQKVYHITITRGEAPIITPPTEAPTQAPTLTGIVAKYTYAGQHVAGEAIVPSAIMVFGVYDGVQGATVNGWGCENFQRALAEGSNVFEVVYEGHSTTFTVEAVAGQPVEPTPTTIPDETTPVETTPVESTPVETVSSSEAETSTEDTTEEDTTEENTSKAPSIIDGKFIEIENAIEDKTLYLPLEDWEVDVIPKGFEKVQYDYKGNTIDCLKNEFGIIAFFLTDKDGANGDFYIYYEDTDTIGNLVVLTATSTTYVFLEKPESVSISNFPNETVLIFGKKEVSAWSTTGKESDMLYVVYAMNDKGETGLYRFDPKTGVFMRYVGDYKEKVTEQDPSKTGEISAEKYNSAIKRHLIITVVLICIIILLIVGIVLIAIKFKALYDESYYW